MKKKFRGAKGKKRGLRESKKILSESRKIRDEIYDCLEVLEERYLKSDESDRNKLREQMDAVVLELASIYDPATLMDEGEYFAYSEYYRLDPIKNPRTDWKSEAHLHLFDTIRELLSRITRGGNEYDYRGLEPLAECLQVIKDPRMRWKLELAYDL